VGGRQDEQRVGAVVGRPPRQREGLPGGRRAGAGDHRDVARDGLADRGHQRAALVGIERRGLAGRAGDDHRPRARVDHPAGVGGGGACVELAGRVETA
jgi:hypothetical protein